MEESMKSFRIRLTAAAAAMMVTAGTLAVPAFALQRQDAAAQAAGTASSARASREMEGQTMNSVFLLPDSDTYYISESDISWMDDTELMLARNEFYARRGRKFATKSIQDYFNRQGWYYGTINPDDFTSEMFNRYEQANVDFIVAYEKKRKEVREQKKRTPQNAISGTNASAFEESEHYTEIVDLYGSALQDEWSEEEYALAGMNNLVSGLDLPEDLGYIFMDLDGDGKDELLIGPTDPQLYGEGAVFEIYTLDDGIPVEVASSDDENFYYICEDNTVRREIALEEGHWEIDYYDLADGELVCKDMLIMDESLDTEDPWFMVEDAGETVSGLAADEDGQIAALEDEYEAISYEEASEMRASHVSEALEYIPYANN